MFGSSSAFALSVWLVSSPLTSSPLNEWAYGHWNKMTEISRAYAFEEICPGLVVNTSILEDVTRHYRIRLTPGTLDFRVMSQGTLKTVARWVGRKPESICLSGLWEYGPQGTRLKNLLLSR